MTMPQPDTRSDWRKAEDERIAAEPRLAHLDVHAGAAPKPLEEHLRNARRRPIAVMGIVESGVVRPIDPEVALPEGSRVVIITFDHS
jgi:hypothetical protein